MATARGTFEVEVTPGPPEVGGAVGRFELTKTWHGDVEGTGRGVMLSAGNPVAGSAGYVALEVVDGAVDGRRGTFALQQSGTLHDGGQHVSYQVVPGSGTDDLAGLVGDLALDVVDGEHRYVLTYDLPPAPV